MEYYEGYTNKNYSRYLITDEDITSLPIKNGDTIFFKCNDSLNSYADVIEINEHLWASRDRLRINVCTDYNYFMMHRSSMALFLDYNVRDVKYYDILFID